MKVTSLLPVIVGAQLGLAMVAFAAPGDNPARVRGQVTKVDATAKTITVSNRRTQSETTFSVNSTTKYRVSVKGALSDLKVGDHVRVMGQENGTAVDARMIAVVSGAPNNNRPGGGRMGRGVSGVIATTTPSLTVKTDDGQTDTVNTTAETNIMTSKEGAFTDVEVGKNVNATLDTSTPPVATEVQVMPAFGGRRPGN